MIPLRITPENPWADVPQTAGQRLQRERESAIYWATLHAEAGCEASARELEELLSDERGDEDEPLPASMVNEYFNELVRGQRAYNRQMGKRS